jgi:uncharacterized Tic20 family protein
MRIKNHWNNIPIFITENGIADKYDKYRAPYVVSHLQQVRKAMDHGAHLIGYLHWSFKDNYEWLDNYSKENLDYLASILRAIMKMVSIMFIQTLFDKRLMVQKNLS